VAFFLTPTSLVAIGYIGVIAIGHHL